ncbi:hypothetical protein D9M68_356320 [compost metagenome]
MRRTIGPLDSTSMSMKFAAVLRMKYSLAMLRPPETAKLLSATSSLLCMRWLMRPKSPSENSSRAASEPAREGSGLNSRTSMFGKAERLLNTSSSPAVYRSSTSSRTRTPRAAASPSSLRNSRPTSSLLIR